MHQRKASRKEAFAVAKLIEANGTAKDGIWTYAAGWSDERVVAETATTLAIVSGVRRDLFGAAKRHKKEDALRRLTELSASHEDALRRLTKLELERIGRVTLATAPTRQAPRQDN